MKWAGESYVRVTRKNGISSVHLVTEWFFWKRHQLLGQNTNRVEARIFAFQQAAAHDVTTKLEDE